MFKMIYELLMVMKWNLTMKYIGIHLSYHNISVMKIKCIALLHISFKSVFNCLKLSVHFVIVVLLVGATDYQAVEGYNT